MESFNIGFFPPVVEGECGDRFWATAPVFEFNFSAGMGTTTTLSIEAQSGPEAVLLVASSGLALDVTIRCVNGSAPVVLPDLGFGMLTSQIYVGLVAPGQTDPLSITISDPLHSDEEDRFVITGQSHQGRLLIVVHTDRADHIRIISARPATPNERKAYENG